MKFKVRHIHIWILILQLLLRNGFFDIYAINDVVVSGIRLRDLSFVVAFLWTAYVVFVYRGYRIKNTFSGIMWAALALLIINCGVSYLKFGQPLVLGFQTQRDVIAGFAMFQAINTLVYRGKLNKEEILDAAYKFGILQLALNTLHWLLYSYAGISLFHGANVVNARYGSARIWFSQDEIIVFVIAIAMNRIMKNKKHVVKYSILLIWGLAYFMVVEKLRACTLALGIAVVITVLAWRKSSIRKTVMVIAIIVASVVALDRVPILQDLVQTFFNDNSISANTMVVRNAARFYYLQQFLKSPIFGWGAPHADWSQAFAAQGKLYGYVFSDNGFFSFLYIYGGIGLLWFITLIVRYIKRTIYKVREQNYTFVFWGIYQSVMLITGMFWMIKNQQLPFVIMLVLLSVFPADKKNEQSGKAEVIGK